MVQRIVYPSDLQQIVRAFVREIVYVPLIIDVFLQVKFYGGEWVWPIITHVSMPLAIFYRFHSTVCLCEIWKKSFKYKTAHNAYG
jgi:hypothetical protein